MQALWMLLAAALLASMSVCVKYASVHFHASELVFFRGLISLVFMAIYARFSGLSLKTTIPAMHFWRSIVGVTSLGAWFYAIGELPLATAMTLNYMSSVWIAAFLVGGSLMGALTGGQHDVRRQGPLVLAVLAGFVGVVLMLRPTLEQNQLFAGLVGLISGFFAAFAYMHVMALGRTGEPVARIVFYFALGTTLAGLLGTAVTGLSTWDWGHAFWLLPMGILASLGQVCLTRAFSRGSTLVVANLQYTGIVFAALYGMLLFEEQLPTIGWIGMWLIIASGVASTVLRTRAVPDSPAEEH
jgi:S-adenosylmethionine uptake transporter